MQNNIKNKYIYCDKDTWLYGTTKLLLSTRVRDLTSAKIGTLLKITGQVVRTHPVHPELVSGQFICLDCQTLIKDVEQQFKYTQVRLQAKLCHNESLTFRCLLHDHVFSLYLTNHLLILQPTICRNPVCSNRSKFMLDVNKSKFVDFQKVRIQETQAELPRGSIPRR